MIESMDDAAKRFDLKMERGYRFVINPMRELAHLQNMARRLMEQVEVNI